MSVDHAGVTGASRMTGDARTRLEKAAAVRDIHHSRPDLSVPERARAVGLSTSAYRNLFDDPDGAKQRARRETYAGVCRACGTPTRSTGTSKASDHCPRCAIAARPRAWSRESIIEALRLFHARSGRSPTASDAQPSPSILARMTETRRREVLGHGVRLPPTSTVQNTFGGWSAALAAAGLPPTPRGKNARRERDPRPRLSAGEIIATLHHAEEATGRPPTAASAKGVYEAAKAVFGSWSAALEAAGYPPHRPWKRLTPDSVELVRQLLAEGRTQKDVARAVGCHQVSIGKIARGQSYRAAADGQDRGRGEGERLG